jgi:hypothetical protein
MTSRWPITKKLKLTLFKKDHELITKSPTKNTEAYERYPEGRFYVTRRGAWIITALECFQQAVAMDPEFAPCLRCLRRCKPFNCLIWFGPVKEHACAGETLSRESNCA